MPVVNINTAGIDIGDNFHMVCPRQGQVKEFGVVTRQLHELAKYLQQEGITTVAIKSTRYHWKPLFVLLQDYGFEVLLVNAPHIKNVRSCKTDVIDSQWIQLLHSLGLLNVSFQLDNLGEDLRQKYLVEKIISRYPIRLVIQKMTHFMGSFKKSTVNTGEFMLLKQLLIS